MKTIDLRNKRPAESNQAIRDAVKQVMGKVIMPPSRPATAYLAKLAVLRSNIMLVAADMDNQGDIDMPDGDTVQTHLHKMESEIKDCMIIIQRQLEAENER